MKKFITIVALLTAVFSSGQAQTCDTLANVVSTRDTPTLIPVDTIGGFLSGNNAYGDLAVAEAFAVTAPDTFLTTAIVYFGYVTINPTDSNNAVTIYVWDNSGVSVFGTGAPGIVIDSQLVTLGQIALAVTEGKGLLVHFSSPVSLTTDSVFVGVQFPALNGDTVAVLTNTFYGPDGNGYILALDPSGNVDANGNYIYTWNSYNDNYGVTGASVGNYIQVAMCTSPNLNGPYSNFVINATTGCNPLQVLVSDFSGPPLATNISWTFGDGNTASGPNASDVYTNPGTYTVIDMVATDTGQVVEEFINGSLSVTVTASPVVTVNITPASSDSTADGAAYITVVSSSGHYFTNWYDSTGVGNNLLAIGDTLANVANGLYLVDVQDQNGCVVDDSVFIEPLTTGIIKISPNMQVNVYPNPATNVLNMVWSSNAQAEVAVVDLQGNVLSTLITNGGTKTVYDIHQLASGPYILRITDKASGQQQSRLFTKF